MDEEDDEEDVQGGANDIGAGDDDQGDDDYNPEENHGAVPPVPARLNIAAANANAKPQANGVSHSGGKA